MKQRYCWTDTQGFPSAMHDPHGMVIGDWTRSINCQWDLVQGWHSTSNPLAFHYAVHGGTKLWVVECKDFNGGTQGEDGWSTSILPVREVPSDEVEHDFLKARFLRPDVNWDNITPAMAFFLGRTFGPSNETRSKACEDSRHAVEYARYVDECPRPDTREAACQSAYTAYSYARYVDEGPHDDTRKAAKRSPYFSLMYALYVDKGSHEDTRIGASVSDESKKSYEREFGHK